MDFLSLKTKAFGLDISRFSLKFVQLKKKNDRFSLVAFGERPIEPGIIEDGEIKEKSALANIIRDGVAKAKGSVSCKDVVVSLPEEKAFLQVIQMPRMAEEDLKSAVVYEAESYIPLPLEEVYLDSQVILPVFDHLDHADVLLAAIPRKIADSYLETIKKAGFHPIAFEIESLAIARDLVPGQKSDPPILLIDLGAAKTNFMVFSGHSLRFTFSIPVSSGHLTENIARAMGLSLEKAEDLKVKQGLKGKVFEALIPSLVDLTEQIKKYLDYYKEHASHEHLGNSEKNIKKVLLCGGGANMKGLPDFLSSQFELPVEAGDPWVNILKKQAKLPLPLSKSLGFATALGLALRGVQQR